MTSTQNYGTLGGLLSNLFDNQGNFNATTINVQEINDAVDINGLYITPSTSSTLSIASNKTFTVSNSINVIGTDGKTICINNDVSFSSLVDGNTYTFPAVSDTVCTLNTPQTLINKTMRTPIYGFSTFTTSGSTVALTNASNYYNVFTGSSNQTITMPITTTLTVGQSFMFINNSTGVLTVNTSSSSLIQKLQAGMRDVITCLVASGNTPSSWTSTLNSNIDSAGDVIIASGTASTSYTTGAVQVSGGVGVSGALYVGSSTSANISSSGILTVANTTESTSSSSGSIITSGGVGIAKNLYVGGVINSLNTTKSLTSTVANNGTTTLTSSSTYYQVFTGSAFQTILLPSTSTISVGTSYCIINNTTVFLNIQTSTNVLVINALANIHVVITCISTVNNNASSWSVNEVSQNYNINTGSTTFASAVSSTSKTTGSVIVSGGIGATGSIFCGAITCDSLTTGGVITSTNATDSTTTSSGAIISSGGIGIAKNINIGGNATVVGRMTSNNNVINSSNIQLLGTTTTLTATSTQKQICSGNSPQTIVMPVASVMSPNQCFNIVNESDSIITINGSDSSLICLLSGRNNVEITMIGNGLLSPQNNNFIKNYTSSLQSQFNAITTTTSTSITLTSASPYYQNLYANSPIILTLPALSTVANGPTFCLMNVSSDCQVICSDSSVLVPNSKPNQFMNLICVDNTASPENLGWLVYYTSNNPASVLFGSYQSLNTSMSTASFDNNTPYLSNVYGVASGMQITLPSITSTFLGKSFCINNVSSATIDIIANDSTTIYSQMPFQSSFIFTFVDNTASPENIGWLVQCQNVLDTAINSQVIPIGLNMTSTTNALRIPTMTTTQKSAIASPVAGMIVYDTTLGKISSYNGSAWSV